MEELHNVLGFRYLPYTKGFVVCFVSLNKLLTSLNIEIYGQASLQRVQSQTRQFSGGELWDNCASMISSGHRAPFRFLRVLTSATFDEWDDWLKSGMFGLLY